MQTRRDQLQAYRFQNRRALAALVTGEPNVVEPPMRRLTVTTVSGIMIAILIAVGFALFGLVKPSGGSDWKQPGVIIVERGTFSRFVYLHKQLHPVLNYTSAVLALGTNQRPSTVMVDAGDIASAKRGPTIGIDGAPDSLPSSGDLVRSQFSVCSRLRAHSSNALDARVTLGVGDVDAARPLPTSSAVLVQEATGHRDYLLFHGERHLIGGGNVLTTLGLGDEQPLTVGTAFVDGVPEGAPLSTPDVPGSGKAFGSEVDGHRVLVGQLLHVSGSDQYFLLARDGRVSLNQLQAQVLEALPLRGGKAVAPLPTDEQSALALRPSRQGEAITAHFGDLPPTLPRLTQRTGAGSGGHGGVCAVYRDKQATPTFAVPPSELPATPPSTIDESRASRQGHVDAVDLDPGSAALVRYLDGSPNDFLVADPGLRYPVASGDVLSGLGYAGVHPAQIAAQLLTLIPRGVPLDPDAARRPVSG